MPGASTPPEAGKPAIGNLWLDDSPGSIPASPFAGADDKPMLQYCHGAIRGDACSIYLLGDGHAATAEVMLCLKDGAWKLMNGAPSGREDGWLWDLTGETRLWPHMAELLRKRGE